MIKHFCDNCGDELTDAYVYRIEVTQYGPDGIPTIVYRFREVCRACTETVTRILQVWDKSS